MIARFNHASVRVIRCFFHVDNYLHRLTTAYFCTDSLQGNSSTSPKSLKPKQKREHNTYELFMRDQEKPVQEHLEKVKFSSEDASLQSLEKYLYDPTRTVDELLAVDIRPLPSVVRLTCLEAVLERSRTSQLNLLKANALSKNGKKGSENWPRKYLSMEHLARWDNWDLGIDPLIQQSYEPDWLRSPRFELLILATVASANQLPLSRLLNLAGHLRYLWRYYDPMVFASVLRLLTSQINELGLREIFRLASAIREIPRISSGTDSLVEKNQDSSTTKAMSILSQEADLLRTSIIMQTLSRVSGLEEFEAVNLLRLTEELNASLKPAERARLLTNVESSLILNPQQQSLYTVVYTCTRLSLLSTYRKGIVNRCLGQLRRKLHLAHRFPGTDQSRWLSTAVTALANLNVGAPQAVGQPGDSVTWFAQIPVMPNASIPLGFTTANSHPGVDLGSTLSADWIQEIFTDLTGYLVNRSDNSSDPRGLSFHLEVAYCLALLGYCANSIVEQAYTLKTNTANGASLPRHPPFLSLIELLIGPWTNLVLDSVNLHDVGWLPRVEWQFYYRLALELFKTLSPSDSGSADQHSVYVAVKTVQVMGLAEMLKARLGTDNALDILTFSRCQWEDQNPHSYFSDILFKKESTKSPGMSKLALCFVCQKRDLYVNRPLDSLLKIYRDNAAEVPILVFDYSNWAGLDASGQLTKCDEFLTELAQAMLNAPGVQTAQLRTWIPEVT
ncbi:hypothetical protein EG68_03170 [Paragonimus skrjabini miyazakii]|uniref:Uncharacterized protein n=1 Tax=Paragonimus skrjabini miyazakii TaxID=59628 RepID=A0A8S9Z1G2_9TREM|nr:hypothetical protein EG68_03170 [Paragonimus skrjabini miyazakii]